MILRLSFIRSHCAASSHASFLQCVHWNGELLNSLQLGHSNMTAFLDLSKDRHFLIGINCIVDNLFQPVQK